MPDDDSCDRPGLLRSQPPRVPSGGGPGRGGLAGRSPARPVPAMAGPFEASDFAKLVPPDKKLDPDWVKSLFARGEPTIYRGESLALIGMPIGGLCAGQLYLGGDGKLWHWDIFNRVEHTNEAHYANPLRPRSPLDQGFAVVRIQRGDKTEHPHARLARGSPTSASAASTRSASSSTATTASPVEVSLEAFSPFIPLNTDDSSLPATILITRSRTSRSEPVEVELGGWLENAVCLDTGRPRRRISAQPGRARRPDLLLLECSAEPAPELHRASPRARRSSWPTSRAEPTASGPPRARPSAPARAVAQPAPSSTFADSRARGWSTPGPAATRPQGKLGLALVHDRARTTSTS